MSDTRLRRNVGMAPLPAQVRPLVKARVPDSDAWAHAVATEVRELCAQLGGSGWDFAEIAAALNTGRTSLYAWRLGDRDMPAKKLLELRALVAKNVRRSA